MSPRAAEPSLGRTERTGEEDRRGSSSTEGEVSRWREEEEARGRGGEDAEWPKYGRVRCEKEVRGETVTERRTIGGNGSTVAAAAAAAARTGRL